MAQSGCLSSSRSRLHFSTLSSSLFLTNSPLRLYLAIDCSYSFWASLMWLKQKWWCWAWIALRKLFWMSLGFEASYAGLSWHFKMQSSCSDMQPFVSFERIDLLRQSCRSKKSWKSSSSDNASPSLSSSLIGAASIYRSWSGSLNATSCILLKLLNFYSSN